MPQGSQPLATVYAGHQFGSYTAELGDGRALLLGDLQASDGQQWELQLKGSGKTPYSRHGDGRAALRSVIREYLASEAMAALGIPTTRALCIIGSDTQIYRESIELAATMVRLSPSHIRFGHFEYFYYSRQSETVKQLADIVIRQHYPHCLATAHPYLAFFTAVVESTARLVAQWQAIGFCHGVMNTDNMSIAGVTLDYGPFAFLNDYQPGFVCNLSDERGRYAFNQQPSIALWNCVCLAQTLSGLVEKSELEAALSRFEPVYAVKYTELMCAKLGMAGSQAGDAALIEQYLALLEQCNVDYSLSFNLLGQALTESTEPFFSLFNRSSEMQCWFDQLLNRIDSDAVSIMKQSNPRIVLRSYLIQQVIDAAEQGDYRKLGELHSVLQRPYQKNDFGIYSEPTPLWGKNLSISCSS
ncbi:UPF0061 protein [Amphritea balenae]|nr:UPF0061 protein [Amphritea balenae]